LVKSYIYKQKRMKDLDFYISKNGRYVMLENIVYDAVKDRHAHIDEICLSDLLEIIGENVNFVIQKLNSNISDISSFTRKNVYHVLEYFETDEKLSLMVEYEVKFGSSLLTESDDNKNKLIEDTWEWIKQKALFLEQTLNPFNKDFYTASNWKKNVEKVGTAVKDVATNVGKFIKDPIGTAKKGIQWIKENGFPAMMEKIREGLSSGTGIAIQIFAQLTGVGNIAVGIVWGTMLIYDLWKVFTGKDWNWLDLVFDVLGIISTGAAKGFKILAKNLGITGKGGLQGMKSGLAKLSASPKTKGFMTTIANGVSGLGNLLKNAGTFLSEKLGLKWVSGVTSKAVTWIAENIVNPIKGVISPVGKTKIAQGTKETIKSGAQSDIIGDVASSNTVQNIVNKGSVADNILGNPEDMSSAIASGYNFS
jgi:hypothetical protein